MSDSDANSGLGLYREAGVDIQKGEATVDWLKSTRDMPKSPFGEVLDGIGGFAGLFRPDLQALQKPVLVGATDGVGTKIDLAIDNNVLEGIGQDLVAMCVNDLYTIGAVPLFFLDYYVTESLNENHFKTVITSIKHGLKLANTALLGGETAEHPGTFPKGRFDLAGFVVGMVDEEKILQPQNVVAGDVLVGFPSSGFHSNGFSLLRKWLAARPVPRETLMKLLTPTEIYGSLPKLIADHHSSVHSAAHITGGGLSGNVCRFLSDKTQAVINLDKIPTPDWMNRFIADNNSSRAEVESVFNLGIGMVLAVKSSDLAAVDTTARHLGMDPHVIGEVTQRKAVSDDPVVFEN